MTDNAKHLENASELIKAFAKEKEPERLREAAIELENVDLRRIYEAAPRRKMRAQTMEAWLSLIQTIDKNYDPNFDAADVPAMKVMPPKLKDGTQLPPGADPKAIDDPQERREYEKSIAETRAKQERYLIQSQLAELSETINTKFEAFIRRDYGQNTDDRNEVRAGIEKINNEARRAKLLLQLDLTS